MKSIEVPIRRPSQETMTEEERLILMDYVKYAGVPGQGYERVIQEHKARGYSCSRGKIHHIADKFDALKNRDRKQEKLAERKARQLEFIQEVLNATETMDVLDFLASLPDEAVHLHVTSPPYNLGKPYGDAVLVDKHRFHYYLGWLLQVLSEMARTTRQGGVIFLQVGATITDDGQKYPLDCLLFEHMKAMGLTYQNRVIWKLPHGLTPKHRLAERHETALVFSKGTPRTFNPTPARTPQKEPDKRAFKGGMKGRLSGNPFGAWPTDVWEIRNIGANNRERTGHPAQFPEELVRRAIMLYTMPDELVCDVFAGSGTTNVVAKRSHRQFIGCDLFYENTRGERLASVDPDLATRFPGVTNESLSVWQAEVRVIQEPPGLLAFLDKEAG